MATAVSSSLRLLPSPSLHVFSRNQLSKSTLHSFVPLRCARGPIASASLPSTKTPSSEKRNQPSSLLHPEQPANALLLSYLNDALNTVVKTALAAALVAVLAATSFSDAALAAKGGGRVGGSSFSSSRSARISSGPSASYSSPSTTYIVPSTPYFAPSPFFWGPSVVVGGGGFGFGGLFNFMLMGIVVYFVASSVMGFLSNSSEEDLYEMTERTSVVKLQIGLLGIARGLQKDLDRIATRADTSSPEGLHYLLQETVLALLRNPDYCVYGVSKSETRKDSYSGEQLFNQMSMEERSKFKEETLSNVNSSGVRRVARSPKEQRFNSEYIVVTLIAATNGDFAIPEINSTAQLREALTKIGSISVDQLEAVEVLWTPQDDEDTLSERELFEDFPALRPL